MDFFHHLGKKEFTIALKAAAVSGLHFGPPKPRRFAFFAGAFSAFSEARAFPLSSEAVLFLSEAS